MNDKTPQEPMAESEHPRPLWQTLVGVAAAVAIVSGAGFALGASGVGTPLSSNEDAPVSLDENANEPSVDTESGTVAGQPMSEAKDDAVPNVGRYTYTALGLSAEAGTAIGYGFDPRSASNVETIAALAAALGVEGTPQLNDGAWTVGIQDGTGPTIYVSLDGALSFSYSNPTLQTMHCDANGAACTAIGPAPSEESALAALRDVLGKLGYDLSDFEFTADTFGGSLTTQAWARRLVGGLPTDQLIGVDVAASGIASVHGALAPIVELGEYSIVSERDAFERLYDSRFGGSMTGYPGPVFDSVAATEDWAPPGEPPTAPTPGVKISWPVINVQIVSGRLGLASQYQPDGTVLLLPAYEFTDSNGGTRSVIAVDESYLDFSAE